MDAIITPSEAILATDRNSETGSDGFATTCVHPVAVDLFAGAGGMSLGAINAGFEVRAAVEHCRHAASTYRRNIRNTTGCPVRVFERDIRRLDPHEVMDESGLLEGDCDLLLGGPPCQGFSLHRLGKAGVDDPRNALLLHHFTFVAAFRPRMFLLENVPGMLQPKHAGYLGVFLRKVRDHGFQILGQVVLNARDYGVPQNRRRVFILAYDPTRVKFDATWPPAPSHGDSTRQNVKLAQKPWRTAADAFCRSALPDDPNDIHMNHGPELIETFRSTPSNGGSRAESNRTLPCHRAHNGHRDVYGRICIDRPSPTMTTACINPSKGRFVHPTEHHGITVRQAARLQTFPDDFVFEGGLTAAGVQIGNAVPVRLAKVLCEHLRPVLK